MCGIAGFAGPGTRTDLVSMTSALAHRGPDGEGFCVDVDQAVYFGHRRLAIIDIASGVQPMSNGDGSTTIVFNGEIYNHHALRRQLEAAGQVFHTDHSDTEVIVLGYDLWGEAVVDRLEGMFAFAIHDAKRKRLFLARDRFGEKPLYLARLQGGIAFASELRSLRQHPQVATAAIDSLALQKFLAYSFLPGRITPYKGVWRLPAGAWLAYDLATGAIREERYWTFAIEPDQRPTGGPKDWVEELRALLRTAVGTRLESDVPLGVFLSGGIDSSAVATLATPFLQPRQLMTFTVGFDEPSFDESGYAQSVADAIGSLHRLQSCRVDSMRELAPSILERVADPLGDPSLLPTYLLSAQTAQHVKVALSGDGGDELFAGYDPFKALKLARVYERFVPKTMHAGLRLLAARMPLSDANMSLDFKVNRALRGLTYRPALWNPVWLGALDPQDQARAFDGPVRLEELYSEAIEVWDETKPLSDVDRTLEFFTRLYLCDDILIKSDRAGMLNGLEVRAPFLHLGLVDFVRRLPHEVKFRNGETKWILKQALRGVVPDFVLRRRKKGFGIPVADWLRRSERRPWQRLDGVRDGAFASWDTEHRVRRRDHRGALWCRDVLDLSLRRPSASVGS